MPNISHISPWWAAVVVWIVVNAVNILQAAGFLSRLRTGSLAINHALGYVMMGLAVPAAATLVALIKARTDWRQWIGLVVYIVFIILMICVEYIWPVEFRNPARYEILIPYLLLFFGAILLMGLPMFRMDWRLWLVTLATTILLLTSMILAMRKGVG